METRFISSRLISALAAALCAGCATPVNIAEQSARANLAVEQAANEQLLLNVVRAMHRHPVHFTNISALKGPLGYGSPKVSITLPTFAAADIVTKRLLGISGDFKPNEAMFDVNVWDGPKFQRGINTAVDEKTFAYYLSQGWPRQLIFNVLVREIRAVDKDDKVVEYFVNYPENGIEFGLFQQAAETFDTCELAYGEVKDQEFGPPMAADKLGTLNFIAGLKAADLVLEPDKDAQGNPVKDANGQALFNLKRRIPLQRLEFRDRPDSGVKCRPLGFDFGGKGGLGSSARRAFRIRRENAGLAIALPRYAPRRRWLAT